MLAAPDAQFQSIILRTFALAAVLICAGAAMLFGFVRVLRRESTDRTPGFVMLGVMMVVIFACCLVLMRISF